MSQQGHGHTRTAAPRPSLLDLIKVVLRLGPKQINDEIQLALGQMKSKGVAAGVAVALMVVGLVFVTFLVVALIIAAVAAFALMFELWAAALIVAGIFLIIAAIFALIGLVRLKKTMPLIPEDAIRGVRLDLGVAMEGSSFDPKELDRQDEERRRRKEEAKQAKAEQKKQDAKVPGAGEPEAPDYRELLRRTALRRDHIGSLQDQILARANRDSLKSEASGGLAGLKSKLRSARSKEEKDADQKDNAAPQPAPSSARPASGSSAADGPAAASQGGENSASDFVSTRWKPLAVLGASTAAGAVFLRELVRK